MSNDVSQYAGVFKGNQNTFCNYSFKYAIWETKVVTTIVEKQNIFPQIIIGMLTICSLALSLRQVRSKMHCLLSVVLLLSVISVWNSNLHLLKISGFKAAAFYSCTYVFLTNNITQVCV